jgi:hypothetical protein
VKLSKKIRNKGSRLTAALLDNVRWVEALTSCFHSMSLVNSENCYLYADEEGMRFVARKRVGKGRYVQQELILKPPFFDRYECSNDISLSVDTSALYASLRKSTWGNIIFTRSLDQLVITVENNKITPMFLQAHRKKVPAQIESPPQQLEVNFNMYAEPLRSFVRSVLQFKDQGIEIGLRKNRLMLQCGPTVCGGGYLTLPCQTSFEGEASVTLDIRDTLVAVNCDKVSHRVDVCFDEGYCLFTFMPPFSQHIIFKTLVQAEESTDYVGEFQKRIDGEWVDSNCEKVKDVIK